MRLVLFALILFGIICQAFSLYIRPVRITTDPFYPDNRKCYGQITELIDTQVAVVLLIPYIYSGMTVSECVNVCTGAAYAVLGPLGIDSNVKCEPLCECALSKLEQLAA